jgi:formyl-CoA transferase
MPRPSNKPFGGRKALEGVRILDFTHVQSGPTCTQLAGLVRRRRDQGRAPRRRRHHARQLRDVPGADSLYFTMLNHNKRSITLDSKNPKGKEISSA